MLSSVLAGSLLGCSLCRRPEEAAGSRATASLPSQPYLQSSLTPPEVQTCALTITPAAASEPLRWEPKKVKQRGASPLWGRAGAGWRAHSQHQAGLQQMCCGVGVGRCSPRAVLREVCTSEGFGFSERAPRAVGWGEACGLAGSCTVRRQLAQGTGHRSR